MLVVLAGDNPPIGGVTVAQETAIQQEVPEVTAPTSVEELEELLRQLGEAARRIEHINARTARRIAREQQSAAEELRPFKALYDLLSGLIFDYVIANRDVLTKENGTPTQVRLRQGTIKFISDTTGTLVIDDEDGAIKALEGIAGGRELVKTTKSIIKDQLKRSPLLELITQVRVVYKKTVAISFPKTDSDIRQGITISPIKRELS
ncbi:hypothetical protein CYG49_04790 [Candidatus Saccharibacteria bacterium]|nr:MAG: hypothetical protein CYG49_04790 [Candidatus Saccharibacteria bacterium]